MKKILFIIAVSLFASGCMTSSDALAALNCKIYCLLDAATERTKANKRSTVKPQDL